MKIKSLPLYFLLMLNAGVFCSAHAEPFNPRCPQPGNWFFDFGVTGYHYRYQEQSPEDNSFFMRYTGPMYGLYYTLGYQPKCTHFRFALEGYRAWGTNMHYVSARTGSSDNSDFDTSEIRLLAYYPWDLSPDSAVELYSGLGDRFLEDDCDDKRTSTGHYGYFRSSNYTYIPIGTRFIRQFNCNYLIAHLEYDWFIEGEQESCIHGGITNEQNSGVGLRAGLDVQFPSWTDSCDLLVGTFVRYWSIKDSTINLSGSGRRYGQEPRNRTWEVGAKIGFVF